MNKVQQEWERMRIAYQQRYAIYARKIKEQPDNQVLRGHLLESSYVLINVFGLSSKQVLELEANDYWGLTNKDIEFSEVDII